MFTTRFHVRTSQGDYTECALLVAFIHTGDWNGRPQYSLAAISVYQDGTVDCWGRETFEEFKRKVRSGRVATQPPANAEIKVDSIGMFTLATAAYEKDPEDLILEVADEIEALNRRPTSSRKCRDAWAAYEKSPTEAAREALRVAYEAVPKHNRKYVLGDQDRRDGPIRRVLHGAGK
jgi:hypothetical protein